jgi:hypothetical protein
VRLRSARGLARDSSTSSPGAVVNEVIFLLVCGDYGEVLIDDFARRTRAEADARAKVLRSLDRNAGKPRRKWQVIEVPVV